MSDTDHFVSAISTGSEADFLSAVGDDDFDLVSPTAGSSALGDDDDSDADGWANFSQPRR